MKKTRNLVIYIHRISHDRSGNTADRYVYRIKKYMNNVILQPIRSKCMPALLYGLEACPLRSSDNNSLDFVINPSLYETV